MRFLVLTLALLIPAAAEALDLYAPERLQGAHAYDLSRTEQVIELVRRERPVDVGGYTTNSDLRVSLVVMNTGFKTDVSPRHDLHIAMYNVLEEYANGWALEPVISVYRFERVERKAAGIYMITAIMYDTASETCPLPRMALELDARQLSVDVRQSRGVEEYSDLRQTTRTGLTARKIECTTG